MTQLIKIKKPYKYYAQLIVAATFALFCFYVVSVNAGEYEYPPVKTSFAKPAELKILSKHLSKKALSEATLVNQQNLQLSVSLPKQLLVNHSDIQWQIRRHKKLVRELNGNDHSVNLPDGQYTVRLEVGRYQIEKQVAVQQDQQIQPYFQVNIGRLQVRADHPVDWKITGPDKATYQVINKRSVNELLPDGEYKIKAVSAALVQQQVVDVLPGKYISHHFSVPLGKVNLMAVRNNQPLLQSMKWEVFRLERNNRRKVGEYHLHTKSISVPPGQYEAVARHQNTTSKRRFWVRKETTNKVVLVME